MDKIAWGQFQGLLKREVLEHRNLFIWAPVILGLLIFVIDFLIITSLTAENKIAFVALLARYFNGGSPMEMSGVFVFSHNTLSGDLVYLRNSLPDQHALSRPTGTERVVLAVHAGFKSQHGFIESGNHRPDSAALLCGSSIRPVFDWNPVADRFRAQLRCRSGGAWLYVPLSSVQSTRSLPVCRDQCALVAALYWLVTAIFGLCESYSFAMGNWLACPDTIPRRIYIRLAIFVQLDRDTL